MSTVAAAETPRSAEIVCYETPSPLTKEQIWNVGSLILLNSKDVIVDATLHERAVANDESLLQPVVLHNTRLEAESDPVIVLLHKLFSQPGRNLWQLGAKTVVRHV
jgi:hypothetical protein